jgi:hypothetical protein
MTASLGATDGDATNEMEAGDVKETNLGRTLVSR